MIAPLVPLLAAADDWLKIIGFIIVALIWVFNHFVGAKGQQQRRPQRPEMRPRPPGAPAGRQEVNDEVAEFLRRTAERTAAKKRPEPEPAQPARRPLAERRLKPMPAGAEAIEAVAVEEGPSDVSVSAHVQQFDAQVLGDRSGFATHADQEARLLQAHVEQTFDHQVGQLAQKSSEAPAVTQAPSPAPAAAAIAALLADPANVRSAVVLNEILRRPTDRW